ncbi:MAG TPA: GNAT family N-acetyltransferase [Dehalococcoidia bacterium]|nr:GNAT family N-acetyltransferase [Dehalococcoidia bacterium]
MLARYHEPVTLEARHVRLEPLKQEHAPDLFEAAQNDDIWRWLYPRRPAALAEMQSFIDDALAEQLEGAELPFAVIDPASARAVGSTRFLGIEPAHRHVEIGFTWYARDYWRTAVNTECKYLLLRHAFEKLDCIRVQLVTDLRNERSQRAIERIGGVREGVLRKNRVVLKDGYQRSSVCYSILAEEWPGVKSRLEAMQRTR